MGCDIHWVIERKHKDGAWEAVLSETGEIAGEDGSYIFNIDDDDPGVSFGMRSYQYFGALSGVRINVDGDTIATAGMPDDISAYTADALEWTSRIDLHSHSWCTLGQLRAAASGALKIKFLENAEVLQIVGQYLSDLEALLSRDGEDGPKTIFRGRACDSETETYHPDMITLSNHEKLALRERARGFEPVNGETVRLLVAYDN